MGRALALVGVGVGLWVAPAAAVPATEQTRTTADEPHYLLTALSLGEDRSLDVADELREKRYEPFHEVPLPRQAKLQENGRRVSPHDPLLPALLAGPMTAGGWVAAKLTLAALAGALAAALVWVAVRRFAVPLPAAALAVACFAGAAPLAVYGTQVYPEIAAALAVTIGIGALTGPLRRGGVAVLAATTIALPWLSVKYVPVAAALAATAAALLVRRGDRRAAVVLGVSLAAAAALFAGAHEAWYGGLTPYAAGLHFGAGELSVAGRDPDLLGRATRLVGLLVDRDFGLAAWQPAYLLAVPAFALLARRRPAGWVALAVPFAAGWLNATFVALTMQGWWFPGRQVVVVLPAAVLAVAWWAARDARALRAVAAGAFVGALIYAGLVVEGLLGRIDLVVNFESASLLRVWRLLLPDYRRGHALDWALHGLWIAVVGLGAWVAWRVGPPGDARAGPPGVKRAVIRSARPAVVIGSADISGSTDRRPT